MINATEEPQGALATDTTKELWGALATEAMQSRGRELRELVAEGCARLAMLHRLDVDARSGGFEKIEGRRASST